MSIETCDSVSGGSAKGKKSNDTRITLVNCSKDERDTTMTTINKLISDINDSRGGYHPEEVKELLRKAFQAGWASHLKHVKEQVAGMGDGHPIDANKL